MQQIKLSTKIKLQLITWAIKMLKEKSSINNSQELGAVHVTLDGYQFTQFTPNSVEAPRFANFKMVLFY